MACAMVLPLLGCGKRELTHEEKMEIYYEIKAELEAETQENPTEASSENDSDEKIVYEYTTETSLVIRKECPAEKLISVEDLKFDVGSRRVHVKVKIRNLTGVNVDNLFVDFQTIDENGDVIDSTGNGVRNLDNNQADWFPFLTSTDYASAQEFREQVKSIRIYSMQYQVGASPLEYHQFTFTEPIVIDPMDITES